MAPSVLNTALVLATLWAAQQLFVYLRKARRAQKHYPPGPPGLPLIGHLKLPEGASWVTYTEWGKQYDSDIIYLNVVGSHIVIVNSMEAASDLMEKRSLVYSDRPSQVMLGELCSMNWHVVMQRYGNFWRDGRKVSQRGFGPQAVLKFRERTEEATHAVLRSILYRPKEYRELLRHMIMEQVVYTSYGIKIKEKDDPFVTTAEHASEAIVAALIPGVYAVDYLPFLRHIPEWFPGAKFQKEAKAWSKSMLGMLEKPFVAAKQKFLDGDLPADCAIRGLFEEMIIPAEDPAYMEDVVKKTLGSSFAAGTDTTIAGIWTFVLAMVLHPEAMKKAQAEIDRVCPGRLPEFSDYDSLPYVHAVVKECVRWRPIAPLNLAHRSTADDEYKGYFIPEGSIVIANVWEILHDPKNYEDPETFNPDRFMMPAMKGEEPRLDPKILDPSAVIFGFGRRICPGRWLAYDTLFATVAGLIAAFDIRVAKDTKGEPIVPRGEYEFGTSCIPKPFPCDIVPRSEEVKAMILRTESKEL